MNEPSLLRGRVARVPAAVRAAVLCCFAAGFFAHLFAFTNILPNSDGITRVVDAQQMTVSGRWFLHYASLWHGFVQSPAVIGFFSLVFLSLAAGLSVSLLRIKSPLAGGLCGALAAVYPAVSYTFLYLFTASAYFFGLLLAVLAVWLAVRFRFGWLFAAPVLACAVGTYQAYLAAAAALALVWLLLYALEGTHTAGALCLTALRLLGFLLLGLALYFGVLWVFLRAKALTLLDYKGISDAASVLRRPFSGLIDAYRDFVRCFFLPRRGLSYVTPLTVALHAVSEAAAVWAAARIIRKNGCMDKPGAFLLTILLAALIPPTLNLTLLLGRVMPIMRYALVFAYVLVLALADRSDAERAGQAPRLLRYAPRAAAYLAAVLLCIGFFRADNQNYTMAATAHRATEAFAANLVARVESTPGYRSGMEVVIVGGFPEEVYRSGVEEFAEAEDYSDPVTSVVPRTKHVYAYLNDWLNVPWREPAEQRLIEVSDSAAFQQMPLYPDDGSVRIEDGCVLVKLAAQYVPKQDYELQYENRR